jgi:protein-L-isoaspartate(D-aspartate) O-methyltransferase
MHPVPIGQGQTISQPYIVALMTELVRPQSSDRVLEVGTGLGLSGGVLARLVRTFTRSSSRKRSDAAPQAVCAS